MDAPSSAVLSTPFERTGTVRTVAIWFAILAIGWAALAADLNGAETIVLLLVVIARLVAAVAAWTGFLVATTAIGGYVTSAILFIAFGGYGIILFVVFAVFEVPPVVLAVMIGKQIRLEKKARGVAAP